MAGGDGSAGRRSPFSARVARRLPWLRWTGRVVRAGATGAALLVSGLAVAIAALLAYDGGAAVRADGFGVLSGTTWAPAQGLVGGAPAIVGTLLTSGIALLLGVPVALGVAILSSEFAPRRLRGALAYVVDLGAMVPSVVYGFWGLLVLVPFMERTVEPTLIRWGGPFAGLPLGNSILTAGIILAIMVIPTIAALSREALRAVPRERREAALGLGATRWEAVRLAILGPAAPGIVGAVVLGLGRALGETIAVVFVIGNNYQLPPSLLASGVTIPSWIVNRFDAASGLELSGLFELAFLLFVISVVLNVGARAFLRGFRDPDADAPRKRRRWFARRPRAISVAPPRAGSTPVWWPRVAASTPRRLLRRRIVEGVVIALLVAALAIALYPLASLGRVAVENGGPVLVRPTFYTEGLPPQCLANCSAGGIAPAIQGTFLLVAAGGLIAIPLGLLVGVYLSEYGRHRFGRGVGVVVDSMVGIPTLIVGVFLFAVLYRYDRSIVDTATAGALALAVIMTPFVARATDSALRTVPDSVRESALALGFPRHRVTWRVVLGTARSTIVTGVLLAVGRAAGETAALLFTAGFSTIGFQGWNQPVASLAPFIFEAFTTGATPNWFQDAWGAALLLLLLMLGVSLAARLAARTDATLAVE